LAEISRVDVEIVLVWQLVDNGVGRQAYLDKLRLNGGGMDAFAVEQRLDLVGNAVILQQRLAADVSGGNDATARQLPDVELVDITHALHLHTDGILIASQLAHKRTDGHARYIALTHSELVVRRPISEVQVAFGTA